MVSARKHFTGQVREIDLEEEIGPPPDGRPVRSLTLRKHFTGQVREIDIEKEIGAAARGRPGRALSRGARVTFLG